MRAPSDVAETAGAGQDEPIAIVGAACRFPGQVRSLTSLWRLLMARRETMREVPAERREQAELAGLPAQVAAPAALRLLSGRRLRLRAGVLRDQRTGGRPAWTRSVEMRAGSTLMHVFSRHPGLVHTARTRPPPAWRRLDAYIAGRTSVAGIMTTTPARTATALGTRLPQQQRARAATSADQAGAVASGSVDSSTTQRR